MIVSHKHKFIFIKTMKTAGTSIEAFLASYCEGSDIVTFLGIDDEFVRRKMGVYPMNNIRPEFTIPDEKDAPIETLQDLKEFRKAHQYLWGSSKGVRRISFGPHTPARKAMKKIGKACWNDYYTFCFDRDPWERTISHFYFSPKGKDIEFATDEQIRSYVSAKQLQGKAACNSKYYTDKKGRLLVKDLFDLANLDEVMRGICTRFGFDFERFKALPKFKGASRKDRRPYEEFLTPQTIDLIGQVNKRAIGFLGYKPRASKVGDAGAGGNIPGDP